MACLALLIACFSSAVCIGVDDGDAAPVGVVTTVIDVADGDNAVVGDDAVGVAGTVRGEGMADVVGAVVATAGVVVVAAAVATEMEDGGRVVVAATGFADAPAASCAKNASSSDPGTGVLGPLVVVDVATSVAVSDDAGGGNGVGFLNNPTNAALKRIR
jgi:hypothetical protein